MNGKRFHFDNVYFRNPQLFDSIVLYQVGDLSCKGGYVIGEHQQFCYEISYIVSGRGFFFANGKDYAVHEGDIILNVPGELHHGKADPLDPFRYFYVGFLFVSCDEEQNGFTHIKKMFDQTIKRIAPNKFGIDVPFLGIFKELIHLNNNSAFMIETYLRQIIMIAFRSFHDTLAIEYAPNTIVDKPKQIVYEVINYVDVHLLQIYKLTQIAEELNYSYSYLSRIAQEWQTGLY